MSASDQELLYAMLVSYTKAVRLLILASCIVEHGLSRQLLRRAQEELTRVSQFLDPSELAAEQYVALSERCWQLEVCLRENLHRP